MRNQIKFIFQIGYGNHCLDANPAFEHALARGASALCGGCTTSAKTGWWCEDGTERKRVFDAPAQSERAFEIELTCEAHKADWVYAEMQVVIATAAHEHRVATEWVHVSEVAMRGRHFAVSDVMAQIAVAAE